MLYLANGALLLSRFNTTKIRLLTIFLHERQSKEGKTHQEPKQVPRQ